MTASPVTATVTTASPVTATVATTVTTASSVTTTARTSRSSGGATAALGGYSDTLIPRSDVGQKRNNSYDQHRDENCAKCESHGNHLLAFIFFHRSVPTE